MIIGRGLLAQAFEGPYSNANDVIIFASGVSNSLCIDPFEFEREKKLIEDALLSFPSALFVYFSTTSIFDLDLQSSPYALHKKDIENFLLSYSHKKRLLIFRLPIVAGRTSNKHTLLNFLVDKIVAEESFTVFANAYRNIISIDDLVKICTIIIDSNTTKARAFNVCNPASINMTDLIPVLEEVLGKKAIFNLVQKGGGQHHIDMDEISPFLKLSNVNFGSEYLFNTLKKYYANK